MKQLTAFRALRSRSGLRAPLPGWGGALLLLALLFAPSAFMLSVIPPLWRDIDAYIQVTQPPGPQTILQYGPVYCFVARIPLYFGYAVDCLRAGNPVPPIAFLLHPTLTDSGVWTLLLSQHIALGCSALYLISSVSRIFLVRLLLAGIWAVNPLFYAFAHCVGSETLSMILLLLLGSTGLRIVSRGRKSSKIEWLFFGLILWLSILTRHLNALLAALLPITFLLLSAHRLIMSHFTRLKWMRSGQCLRARVSLKMAVVALVTGLSCLLLANVSLRGLCYAANIPYEFQAGLSFVMRLEFLAKIPPEKANEFLDQIEKETSSLDVKQVTAQLREAIRETTDWESTAFMRQAQGPLFAPESTSQRDVLAAINRTMRACLWPPREVFVSAVATDFGKARRATIPNVVRSLFVHTIFYYSHREAMPGYASLITFRDKTESEVLASYKRHSYFYRRKEFSYNAVLCVWFIMVSIFALVKKKRNREVAVVYYATALTLVGLAMMLANCVVAIFQPRYTLPMWELTIISALVVFGQSLEHWIEGNRRCPRLRING